jgi:hypothetical protein
MLTHECEDQRDRDETRSIRIPQRVARTMLRVGAVDATEANCRGWRPPLHEYEGWGDARALVAEGSWRRA